MAQILARETVQRGDVDGVGCRDNPEKSGALALKAHSLASIPSEANAKVAHFRVSSPRFSEGQERAGKRATTWLRASDSKFDAHRDARLRVGTRIDAT